MKISMDNEIKYDRPHVVSEDEAKIKIRNEWKNRIDYEHECISNDLIRMMSKRKIVEKYAEMWNLKPSTIRSKIQDTLVWMATHDGTTREQMKTLNSERLEELFMEADDLNEKIRLINMLNKTHGVYETNVNIGNKDDKEIKFDIGV